MTPSLLFPVFKNWAEVKLTDHMELFPETRVHNGWLEKLEVRYLAKIYGGFLENRYPLFDERHMPDYDIHVGLDFWLPQGTEVKCPFDGKIIYTGPQKSARGGWGGRTDVETHDGELVFIFGHFGRRYFSLGDKLPKGFYVGTLGDRTQNGGWKPHLHLQAVKKEYYDSFEDPRDIDAYAKDDDKVLSNFVHPLTLKGI